MIRRFNNLQAPLVGLAASIVTIAFATAPATHSFAQETEPPPDWQRHADGHDYPTDQITVPSWRLGSGPHVRRAFREVIVEAKQATVRVRCDGQDTLLGGIVGPDGWILTKASRLRGTVTCRLPDGRELDARLVGVSREHDVAMLKLNAEQLPTLRFSEAETPVIGSWLASVGLGKDPVAVGVVSVMPREIPHRAGILGVLLDERSSRALVVRVFPKTGAEDAGVRVNDVIESIDGQATSTREQLIRRVREFSPGDKVTMQVERGGESVTIEARLTGRTPIIGRTRSEFQNQLGSELSQRRFGFPRVFQHDSVVSAGNCGGPIVNLDGEVVGFNIARSGRTETYAIASTTLTSLLYKLMSGDLPPD